MDMRHFNKVLATLALAVISVGNLAAQDETSATGYQILKKYFIDGDWRFMAIVLICLILGLAFCIERIITLNLASTNTDKLLSRIGERLEAGDVVGAQEVAKSTAGPTASVLYEGLRHADEGPDAVEKSHRILRFRTDGATGARLGMDFPVHRHCPHARLYGYGNWYDPGL